MVFWSLDMKSLAILGLVAALFHTLNHAIFKSLLFMGAGSVILETHTRNMEEYGGLIKYMPQTAFFFLVGSMAISALPPFNGFFSEWLTFQSLFSEIMAADAPLHWLFLLAAGSLAFTGGLAAMCFVKVFGADISGQATERGSAPCQRVGYCASRRHGDSRGSHLGHRIFRRHGYPYGIRRCNRFEYFSFFRAGILFYRTYCRVTKWFCFNFNAPYFGKSNTGSYSYFFCGLTDHPK